MIWIQFLVFKKTFKDVLNLTPTHELISSICVLSAGKKRNVLRKNLGGGIKIKTIKIDNKSYIKYLEDGSFELHTSVQGPLGAEVYFFESGLLRGRQRRSYSFITKIYNIKYEDQQVTFLCKVQAPKNSRAEKKIIIQIIDLKKVPNPLSSSVDP